MTTKCQLSQTTSHSSMLVALQGDVFCKLNQTFHVVDSLYSNFLLLKNARIYIKGIRKIAHWDDKLGHM